MGVPETLKRLGPLVREGNLWDEARGRVLGFDGHVLLHHFVYAAASDIVQHNDYKPIARMVRQRCQQIIGQGVTPIMVFDGGRMPAKHVTDQARAQSRARAYARHQLNADPAAQALEAAGKLGPEAVRAVISELSEHGIAHVVAPYEADAQLAWLSEQGLIWGAVTVDSDFVMHGVKRIFFKVDYHFGNCFVVEMSSVLDSSEWPNLPLWKTDFLNLLGQHRANFLLAYAICAGCDYDTKVKHIGPQRAIDSIKSACDNGADLATLEDDTLQALAAAMQAKSGDVDDIASWPIRAAKALVVFKNPLVYDLNQKVVVTKSDKEPCQPACARWPFLGHPIRDADAHLRARGAMAPDGTVHDLPPLSLLATLGMPNRLRVDMIEGAILPPDPTVAQLRLWLHTRHGMGDIGLSSARRPHLMDVVSKRQELEAEWEARGTPIPLRDPTGRSLQSIILTLHPQEGWHFPSATEGIDLPRDGWITEEGRIRREAPAMVPLVWLKHWQHVLARGLITSKTILEDAKSRMKEMTTLLEFGYHPAPNLPQAYGSRQETVLFRLFVPASMRDETHRVWVEVSVCRIEDLPPATLDVVRGGCSCAIGSTSRCVHVAILLMVIHHMDRDGEMQDVVPPTSVLCRWNHPGDGPMYDVTQPMSKLPFLKESRIVERQGGGSGRQERQAAGRFVAQCASNGAYERDHHSPPIHMSISTIQWRLCRSDH